MQALQTYATGVNTVIENLYVNNSRVVLGNTDLDKDSGNEGKGRLTDFMFKNLKIINLQITFGDLAIVSANAFRGLENNDLLDKSVLGSSESNCTWSHYMETHWRNLSSVVLISFSCCS